MVEAEIEQNNNNVTDISNIQLQLSNLTDVSLTNIEYNSFNQFFKKFLEKYNISFEEFEKKKNDKNENNEEKQKMINLYYDAVKEYKDNNTYDYYVELEIQKRKYKKEQEELQKARVEYEKIKKEEIIKMVIRQTDYNYEKAKEQLELNDFNYIKVIKLYLNDGKDQDVEKEDENKVIKSTNQEIYSQIRDFMSKSKIR